jgi:nucleoside-diphosphate-sugar epimerase
VTSPAVADSLTGADAVVHLACPDDLESALAVDGRRRRQRAVRAAQAVLTATAAVGARQAVVVTSAMVFGARPDAPTPLPEDAPVLAAQDDGVVGDLLEVEQVVALARRTHPGVRLATLRPAALVGPGVDNLTTRHFEAPRLLTVGDARTAWQFCHVDDLGTAVARVVLDGLDGELTVGCDGYLDQAAVEQLSGMRRLELPSGLAFGTAERLHRVGVLPMPATDLGFVVHPWVVSSARLREAGWTPSRGNAACLDVLLEQVRGRRALASRRRDRVDRPSAALGAAGAAVALVGTAAIWRQARARQHRRRSGRG